MRRPCDGREGGTTADFRREYRRPRRVDGRPGSVVSLDAGCKSFYSSTRSSCIYGGGRRRGNPCLFLQGRHNVAGFYPLGVLVHTVEMNGGKGREGLSAWLQGETLRCWHRPVPPVASPRVFSHLLHQGGVLPPSPPAATKAGNTCGAENAE